MDLRGSSSQGIPSPGSSARGKLLVATPPLEDPNFDRTVVYVLEHNDDGAVGVVLNRADDPATTLADEFDLDDLDAWTGLLAPPAQVFLGGPVGDDSLIALAETDREAPRSVDAWGALTSTLGTVDLSVDPVEVAGSLRRVRIFRGYAGWSPGQLDAELQVGAWMVFESESDDLFTADPADLWRRVVRRQGGRLAWIADAPDDLSAN